MKAARVLLVLSAFLALPAPADDPPAPAATPAAPAKDVKGAKKKTVEKTVPKGAAGASNLIVTKDPVTGELRPATAAEREQLLGRRPLVAPSPEIVTLPDGTVMLKERPENANYAVATRNADGTLSYSCVHGADAARAAVAAAAAPAPPKSADR
ncbi:MAG TPA: hypothetical protein VMN04_00120 [Thermoanaerobaculia bacterium]|nr:hypothetical protein [Thermoanaerobaculia bacterium]